MALGQVKYDPARKDQNGTRLVGSYGIFPWRPCHVCGCEFFEYWDWNMGYTCASCGKHFDGKVKADGPH